MVYSYSSSKFCKNIKVHEKLTYFYEKSIPINWSSDWHHQSWSKILAFHLAKISNLCHIQRIRFYWRESAHILSSKEAHTWAVKWNHLSWMTIIRNGISTWNLYLCNLYFQNQKPGSVSVTRANAGRKQ